MILGFALAVLMNRELKARGVLRALILLPIFAAPVGIGYLGRTIFYEEGGPVNALLRGIGLKGVPWLSNPFWSKISTIIADVWLWTPFVFVIALAGLQALPLDVQEASNVDGASSWQSFRTITVPLMAPILWLILFLRTIDAFKVFDIAASMTVGGLGAPPSITAISPTVCPKELQLRRCRGPIVSAARHRLDSDCRHVGPYPRRL